MVNNKLEAYKLALLLISLKKISKDLSVEDEKLLSNIKLLKSSKGIPKF